MELRPQARAEMESRHEKDPGCSVQAIVQNCPLCACDAGHFWLCATGFVCYHNSCGRLAVSDEPAHFTQ
jgi:hypothetical protein